jgi:hypothetical protein
MTAKPSVTAPFIPSPSPIIKNDSAKYLAKILVFFCAIFALTVLALIASSLAFYNIYAACALASLVWAIVLTVWVCQIKNRQTEAVEILANILSELKKQNC